MTKYALIAEYNGNCYSGWQRQQFVPSVQAKIEQALSSIANNKISVTCSGRTDAGVHALNQVIHFNTNVERPDIAWTLGVNSLLPDDICINWAAEMPEEFDARFSALSRTYQYIILNRRTRPGLLSGLVTWQCRELDESRMQEAAECFLGEHDFTSYRAIACQSKTPFRRVDAVTIQRFGDWVMLTVTANAFLHHMVRNIAGVLMEIGYGKQPVSWSEQVLLARDRTAAGATAPPDGLYLTHVNYPVDFDVPKIRSLMDYLVSSF